MQTDSQTDMQLLSHRLVDPVNDRVQLQSVMGFLVSSIVQCVHVDGNICNARFHQFFDFFGQILTIRYIYIFIIIHRFDQIFLNYSYTIYCT